MPEDKRDLWKRIPRPNFNSKNLTKRMRKVESATVRHAHRFITKRIDNVREVQQNVIIWILAMGLLIGATGLQLMWNQQTYQTTAPANNGTYAEAVLGPVDTLNPLFAKTSAEQSASYLMFSRLLNFDKTGHLNYDLATNVKINDTGTVYTVTIRPDAKWHDGVKLTAKDVAFTVDLMKNPDTRTDIPGWSDIKTRVINDTTIEFTLQSTYAAFKDALVFPIVPKHILNNIKPANIRENKFSQNPIGSGPFKLNLVQASSVKTGNKVIYMARNDDYYRGTAKLARFQLHVYSNNDEILKALTLNEVNAAADLSISDVGRVDTKRYNISIKSIQSGVYAIINTRSSLLNDVALRRALQKATNTPEILSKLPKETKSLDLPLIANQITSNLPNSPKYNLTDAKKILDSDGWKLNSHGIRVKNGKELKLSVVTIKNSELEQDLGIITAQWRALGIVIETKVIDLSNVAQGDVQSILQPRNFDVLLYQLDLDADPDVYAYWHSSQATFQGLNFSNYSNPIIDDALTSARSRLEPALRNAKYLTFIKQWLADVPAIGLYQSTILYATSRSANSFDSSNVLISPIDRYGDVLNWSVGSSKVFKTP